MASDFGGLVMAVVPRNLLNNSGMWLAQRQDPATATIYSDTSGRTMTADCWGGTNENIGFNYQRIDTLGSPETGLRARFYGTWLKGTSTGKLVVSQAVESTHIAPVRGRRVRFQVYLKDGTGANPTIRLGLAQLTAAGTADSIPATFISAFGANGTDPTLGTNLAYLTPVAGTGDQGTISGNALSCSVTSTWKRFGVAFDVPSNAKNLVVLVFGDAQFAATTGFSISQASLTHGAAIEDWMPDNLVQEYERCFRYYQKSFELDTNPASSVGIGTGETTFMAVTAGATSANHRIVFQSRMWAAPSMASFNPAVAGAQVRDQTNAVNCSSTAFINTSQTGTTITTTGNASTTAGARLGVHWVARAEL